MYKDSLLLILVIISLAYSDADSLYNNRIQCSKTLVSYSAGSYTILEKLNESTMHSDIIIIPRTAKTEACKFNSCKAVFKLRGQDQEDHGSVLDFFDHYLLMDYGTGPEVRLLCIYDITSGKKILDTLYLMPTKRIGKDTVSFWIESADTEFSKCPNKAECDGIGIAIEVEHYYNLKTQKLHKTANWRCSCRE